MILIVLAIGIVILVTAIRGTYGTLFTALGQDVPGFVVWAGAIVAVGALGFIPGFKPVSRGLIALVVIVLLFQNYQNILQGFGQVASPSKGTGSSPATAGTGPNTILGAETPNSAFSSGEPG